MTARTRSRSLAAMLASAVLWAAAAGAAWLTATAAADRLEARSAAAAQAALASAAPWATVAGDGLRVVLSGTAPDEVARFRALEAAGTAVDPRRLVDAVAVAPPEAAPPPDFRLELLKNDAGVQAIGLIPAGTDRAALLDRLRRGAAGGRVADLLQTADHPAPAGWDGALALGLGAAEGAAQAKISVAPGKVAVRAVADSAEDKARLEVALARARPEGVNLSTDISNPRPVIAPFTLRFIIDEAGARFDACAADTEAAQAAILSAARQAGAGGALGCTLGLGAPSAAWGEAAAQAIGALGALGAGTVTLSDADVTLAAPASVAPPLFDAQVGRLEAALPVPFRLKATLERAPQPAARAPTPAPAEVTAETGPDHSLTLRGPITDQRLREAVESLARARFAAVDSALRLDPQLPSGWTLRAIAAVDGAAALGAGTVTVTPDLVTVTGVSGNPRAADDIAAALARRLGAGARYRIAVRYDRRLDPALGLPDGQTCVDRGNTVLAGAEIGFAPSKAEIEGAIGQTLAALKDALAECGDFRIEVGGHTDSQGSEAFNATLSQGRAQAVLAAMAEAGIATANMTAHGYGESVPVRDNDTEAGREANRRIELKLLSPGPVEAAPLSPAAVVEGVTGAAPAPPPVQAQPLPPARVPPALTQGGGAGTLVPTGPAPLDADAAPAADTAADVTPEMDAGADTVEAAEPPAEAPPFPGALPGAGGVPHTRAGGLFGPNDTAGAAGLAAGDLRIETVAPAGLTVPYDAPVAELPDASYTGSYPEAARPLPRPGD